MVEIGHARRRHEVTRLIAAKTAARTAAARKAAAAA
jgi:hypothetical protein